MEREAALIRLGKELKYSGYQFTTTTPATHARVVARAPRLAATVRDVFGWSLPFMKDVLPLELFDLAEGAGVLVYAQGLFRSTVRFSSLDDDLFVHSAHPTTAPNAVFFGPDTYRFCAAIERFRHRSETVVDLGCGSGAGGIVAARKGQRLVMVDINPDALAFARVNATVARVPDYEVVLSDLLAQVSDEPDLIVANPPYLRDELHRAYRDGGGELGEGLSVRIVKEAIDRLSPTGALLLYTGAPIIQGEDVFWRAVEPILDKTSMMVDYAELDPDVFGEELDQPAYAAVERIAAVLLTATRYCP